jgi:hypothetical protein
VQDIQKHFYVTHLVEWLWNHIILDTVEERDICAYYLSIYLFLDFLLRANPKNTYTIVLKTVPKTKARILWYEFSINRELACIIVHNI